MSRKVWPKLSITTVLGLALASMCLAILVFTMQIDNDDFSATLPAPVAPGRIAFLFSIYGSKGLEFLHPMSVYADEASGLVYIVNTEKHNIAVFDQQGSFQFTFGSFGSAKGQLAYPYALVKLPDGNLLVSEAGNRRIQEFTPQGKPVGFLVTKTNQFGLQKPGPMRVTANGKLYVGDLSAGKVFIYSREGQLTRTIKNIGYPHGLALDEQNNRLYIASATGGVVNTYPLDENNPNFEKTSFANLGLIRGIDVDNKGNLYVVNSVGSTVTVFKQTGEPLTSFGTRGNENGQLLYPNGIEVTRQGRVYLTDWGNNRVSVWEVGSL